MITDAELERCLRHGMSNSEMATHFGCGETTIATARRRFGTSRAAAISEAAQTQKVLADWELTGYEYDEIAIRCRVPKAFAEKVIQQARRDAMRPKERFEWGDRVYQGKKVKALKTLDGFHQIMLGGSPTWVPVCEVREV